MAKLDILKGGASRSRELARVFGPVALVTLLGFLVAWRFVGPAPPKAITVATGNAGGAYRAFGERFARALEAQGIDVRLAESAGSVENVELLRNDEAQVAFVQGGILGPEESAGLEGLASLYFEPLWVFVRRELGAQRLTDLAGARIEAGAEGSGTRAVALRLLRANGLDEGDARGTTLLASPPSEAAASLLNGEADALLLVLSPDSPLLGELLAAEDGPLRLLSLDRTLAYERRFPFLSHVVLPEGVLDLGADVPDRSVDLVAPAATLLARDDLHPALVPLLIGAAERIHGGGTVLAPPGRFPAPTQLDAPLAPAAERYFEHGLSWLYRVLPFRVAATIDRLKILLLPLLTLLLPFLRFVPPLYRWRIRSRIYRWYQALDRIETQHAAEPAAVAARLADLDLVDREIRAQVNVPASYMEELYNLRMHAERLRERLTARDPGTSAPPAHGHA